MANHTKTITLTDLQQKILSNDLYNVTDNAGLDVWIQNAIDGKINNCWKRLQREWTVKLMEEMERADSSTGLVTMCVGGGQGVATIFERLN